LKEHDVGTGLQRFTLS